MLASVLTVALGAVGDASECPSTAAVALKLAELRAPGVVAPRYDLALGRSASAVTVTAHDVSGGTLSRELPATAPCGELVDAAAVVLLAWEAELVPGSVPVPAVSATAVERTESSPRSALHGRVTASGQLWLSSSVPTWGAQGSFELGGRTFGLALGVLGQGRRTVLLGLGQVSWSRFTFSLGPTVSLNVTDGVDLTAGVAVALGPFFINGVGFEQTHSLVDWDVGVTAHAQLMLPGLFRVRPYVGATFVGWLRKHVAEAATPDVSRTLPFLELAPVLGLAVTL